MKVVIRTKKAFRKLFLKAFATGAPDRIQPKSNEWVFSSPSSESGRLQEPRKPHQAALAIAGIDDLTIH